MTENRTPIRPAGRRLRLWIGLAAGLLGLAALCLRYEVFAAASDPPSPEWRDEGQVFAEPVPLENLPVVVSTRATPGGMTVTVANRGDTILAYSAVGRSGIQLFSEFEEHGRWTPAIWDWCGTGKETYELAPGEEVSLAVSFWDARRERMLGCFSEKDTARCGLIVLASEGGRVTADPGALMMLAGASLAALCVWLTVRIVNQRERWAKWMGGMVGLAALYVASVGPACWITSWTNAGADVLPAIYSPILWAMKQHPEIYRAMNGYSTLAAAPNWRWDEWHLKHRNNWLAQGFG